MDHFDSPVSEVRPKPRRQRRIFSRVEDCALWRLVQEFGENNWRPVADQMQGRSPRQCRERWRNYLSPNLRKEEWCTEEDATLIAEFERLGPRWTLIAKAFRGRSDIAIKNRWKLLVRNGRALMSPPGERPAMADNPASLPVPPR
jgi:hypothetical protein